MKEIGSWANSLLAHHRKLKVAEPLCVYAILDPASSSKIFQGIWVPVSHNGAIEFLPL
jgi:hypothetical protein